MDDSIKVAVIAGTPVDTRMGVEFLEQKSRREGDELTALYFHVSGNCHDQTSFQYS